MKTTRPTRFEKMAATWTNLFLDSPRFRLLDTGAAFDGLKEQVYSHRPVNFVEEMLDTKFGADWRKERDSLLRVQDIQLGFEPLLRAAARSRKFKHEAM